MQVSKIAKPKLVQLFTNLLWANTPKDWILKTTYIQGVLYVSVMVEIYPPEPTIQQYKKIRRSFSVDIINSRSEDIWGLASDCVDEMKTDTNN